MKLEYSETPSVSYEVAKRRALAYIRDHPDTVSNMVADAIWPTHQMTPQGAGGAAYRILNRMRSEGLIKENPWPGGWVVA